MSDESTIALREIAELLKRRVEQEDAAAARALEHSKRGAEISAQIQGRAEEAQARSEEMRRKAEETRKQLSPESLERHHEENRQFRRSLLSELERHNALLSEIIERLRQSSKE